jgi:hypothetical protein
MEFRWVACIALWSVLIGPILGTPPSATMSARPAVGKPDKTSNPIKPGKPIQVVPVNASALRR